MSTAECYLSEVPLLQMRLEVIGIEGFAGGAGDEVGGGVAGALLPVIVGALVRQRSLLQSLVRVAAPSRIGEIDKHLAGAFVDLQESSRRCRPEALRSHGETTFTGCLASARHVRVRRAHGGE